MIAQLTPLRSDPGKLHEALASFDTVLVDDAFAQLLAIAASDEGNCQKHQKMVSTHLLSRVVSGPTKPSSTVSFIVPSEASVTQILTFHELPARNSQL